MQQSPALDIGNSSSEVLLLLSRSLSYSFTQRALDPYELAATGPQKVMVSVSVSLVSVPLPSCVATVTEWDTALLAAADVSTNPSLACLRQNERVYSKLQGLAAG